MAAFFVLGGTLYVYPTSLNPGLPIILGGGFAMIVAIWRLWKGCGRYYHWGVDVAGGLLFWMAVCSVGGLDAYLSQRSLATFVGAIAFLWVVPCALKNSNDWRLSGHAFVLLCTFASLAAWPKAVAEAVKTGEIPPLVGTFVNPDTFSILQLLALMLIPALLERSTSRTGWILSLQMGILFITLVATGCRASLLGLGIGVLSLLGLLLRNRSTSHLKHLRILLAVPIALILLSLPLSNLGLGVFDKYMRSLSTESIALEHTRLEVATRGWRAALQHPIAGAGPGCFGLAFQSVRAPGHDELYVNIAHNDPVEIAVELGLPGFLLWLTLLFACLSKTSRLLQQGSRPVAAASVMSAVLAVTIYSLFNFVLSERPVLWAQFWVFGLALSFPSSRLVVQEHSLTRYLASLGLLFLSGWTLVFGYRSLQADSYVAQARVFTQQIQTEQAIKALEQAIALQPQRVNLRLEFVKLQTAWTAFYPAHDSEKNRLTALQAARESSPANIGVLVALSDLQTETGDLTAAASTMDQALLLTPYRPKLHEKRAAIAIRQGDLETAVTHLFKNNSSTTRDAQLAALLVELELRKAGKAESTFQPLLQGATRDQVLTVVNLAVEDCWSRQLWRPGLSLSALAAGSNPEDLCLQARWASFVGKAKNSKAEWELLDQTLNRAEPSSDACYGDILERWYHLCLEQGQQAKAIGRLEADLQADPRIVRARVLLSQFLFESKASKKAIALVKEGLDLHRNSVPLLTQLANLYEKAGNRDLATNYYREASEADPENQELKAKLQELRNTR